MSSPVSTQDPTNNPPSPPNPNAANASSSFAAANPPPSSLRSEKAHRERCAYILGSWEQLAWWSAHYGESIPQTRIRFLKQMIGLSEDDESEHEAEDWPDLGGEGGSGGGGKGKAGKGGESSKGGYANEVMEKEWRGAISAGMGGER